MTRLLDAHPTDEDLLRFSDGELSSLQARKIRSHLAACWNCRTALAKLEQTVGDCVRYRQSVVHASLPEPPAPWADIYRRFADLDAAEAARPRVMRLWESFRAAAVQPRRWVPAVAFLVIAAVVVDQFRNAASVRAAELLEKATTAQEARPATPRRIQIRTANKKLSRIIGVRRVDVSPEDAQTIATLRPLFTKANYSWDDPLSPASFGAWRNALREKHDQVTTIGKSNYRIRTTTAASELMEATLDLTIEDLRPVEGTLHFRGRDVIELSESVETTPNVQRAGAKPPVVAPKAHGRDKVQPAIEASRPATAGEELKVLAVLHRLGADLGEPVEVTRDGGQVVVRGVGVSPQLGEQINEELTGVPRVSVRLSEPASSVLQTPLRVSESVSLRPEIAGLQARLEKQFGGRAELEQFTDEVLGAGDELMSRVHALRRLAERFPPAVETQLQKDERRLLAKLRREHAVAVGGLALALEERTRPALFALGVQPSTPPAISRTREWQAATEELFRDARAADAALAAMLGGAAAAVSPEELPEQVFSSISRLRASAADYVQNSLE